MDTAGADHEVWWALQTAAIPSNQEAWNQALQIVAAERPNLTLWDWPNIRIAAGITMAADNTHLPGADQYRQRSELIADDVTTRLAGSRHIGDEVTPPAGGASYAVPARSRRSGWSTPATPGNGSPPAHADSRPLGARADLVAPDAAAAAVNVTAAEPGGRRLPTVWPCDAPTAAGVERQLPRRSGPRRPGHDAVAATRPGAVRLQQRGDRCRRRPAGGVRAGRRVAVRADHAGPQARHAQHRQGLDDRHPGSARRQRSRRPP